jgi:hypothetical protein
MNNFFTPFVLFVFASMLILSGCEQKRKPGKGMDLLKYGIPYTVMAPKETKASKIGGGQMIDLKLSDGEAYDVLIFMKGAETKHIDRLKQFRKEEVSLYPNFKKIVEEYNEGFLYEIYSSTGGTSYAFYAIKIVGDNEIDFMSGNNRDFTEVEVKDMIKTILY